MKIKEQLELPNSPDVSVLARDQTYGERVYQGVFSTGINFGVNLISSAAFTYWVNHSHTPVKLFGKQFNRPGEVQDFVAGKIQKLPFMGVFPTESARGQAAKVMSGVLTLTAIGHLVMIPSVWLGAKIKAPFVEHFNRKHYGDAAMDDPSLKARHMAIRTEARPTLVGSVIGRMGTIMATQLTGYSIGSSTNLFGWVGRKANIEGLATFKGIDHFTEFAGDRVGGMLSEAMPAASARLNRYMQEKQNFGWSMRQVERDAGLAAMPYGSPIDGRASGALEHFGKYVVSDILYTLVTSISINPAINFFKQYIPGMTYKPALARQLSPEQAGDLPRVRSNPVVDNGLFHTINMPLTPRQKVQGADTAPPAAPTTQIHSPQHAERLDERSTAERSA